GLMAKIKPTYLLRSPVSIFTATKFTASLLLPTVSDRPLLGGRRTRSLLDRSQIGLRPFGIDDELEGVEVLVPRAEAVEGVASELGKGPTLGVAQQSEVRELQRQRLVTLLQQRPGAPEERRFLAPGQEVQYARPLPRRQHFDPFTVRLPVARSLVDD